MTESEYTSKPYTEEKKQLEGWPDGPALLRCRNGFHYEFLEKGMNDMHKNLTDINPEEAVAGLYLVKLSDIRTSKNGKPYLSGYLMDKSGEVEFKLWNYNAKQPVPANTPVQIEGAMTSFMGKKTVIIAQPNHLSVVLDADDDALAEIIPTAPDDTQEAKNIMSYLLQSIRDKDYLRLCAEIMDKFTDEILNAPAAKSVHHAYRHGLLMHTVHIMNLADRAADIYPMLNRDLLLTAAFLHDIGKPLSEFEFNALGLVERYTVEGALMGHLVAGADFIRDICQRLDIPADKTLLLMHCILSHHGRPEFGAAVRPSIPEADILAKLDEMDAVMELFRTNLEKLEPGEISSPIPMLDNRRIYKHE